MFSGSMTTSSRRRVSGREFADRLLASLFPAGIGWDNNFFGFDLLLFRQLVQSIKGQGSCEGVLGYETLTGATEKLTAQVKEFVR